MRRSLQRPANPSPYAVSTKYTKVVSSEGSMLVAPHPALLSLCLCVFPFFILSLPLARVPGPSRCGLQHQPLLFLVSK